MPPNLGQKLRFYAEAAKHVLATAKEKNVSFVALFLADADSIFGNRQDHDKYEIFVRLAKVPALAPYLVDTALISSSVLSSNRSALRTIPFPIVVKPLCGAQSVGIVGIRDEITLSRFLRKRRRRYIAQHLIREGLEIGVSFTRNPAGPPDFFGVAHKEPVHSTKETSNGFYKVPKYFYHHDLTLNVTRERLTELCIAIAEALGTKSLRFDAFVSKDGPNFRLDTLRVIDVNVGAFAIDEFLFDTRHSPEFVIEQLARKYTYLLLWGARHSPRPNLSVIRKLALHYLYCYIVTLCGHISEALQLYKFRDVISSLPDLIVGKTG
jgi:hypothetical protein